MDAATVAAIIFTVATLVVVGFQLALALGMPWGAYAMGGQFPGRFPPALRVAAVAQAGVLGALAALVLAAAGVGGLGLPEGLAWLAWIPVVVSALSVVMNLASRSAGERRLWVPVGIVLLVASVVVALGA